MIQRFLSLAYSRAACKVPTKLSSIGGRNRSPRRERFGRQTIFGADIVLAWSAPLPPPTLFTLDSICTGFSSAWNSWASCNSKYWFPKINIENVIHVLKYSVAYLLHVENFLTDKHYGKCYDVYETENYLPLAKAFALSLDVLVHVQDPRHHLSMNNWVRKQIIQWLLETNVTLDYYLLYFTLCVYSHFSTQAFTDLIVIL